MPHPDTSCQRSSLHKGFSSRDNLKFAPCGTVKQSPAEYYSALGFRRVIISPVCILMVVSWCLTQSSLVHWQCSHSFVSPPVQLSEIKAFLTPPSRPEFPLFPFDTCMGLEHGNFACQVSTFLFIRFACFDRGPLWKCILLSFCSPR